MDEKNALHSFAHADGQFHLMGCILSAAACSKWWVEDILRSDYAGEDGGITTLGENNLYFLPYLMGERSPHNDPNARGCFIGISMDTTRQQMIKAVYEGVAFALRDSLEVARSQGIDVARSKICGGGAKSEVWQRIMANVLNIEIDVLHNEEGPALGGAILAAVAAKEYTDLESESKRIAKVKYTVTPDAETATRYDKKYEVYKALYPALKQTFPLMK
jgi:xylulokinase